MQSIPLAVLKHLANSILNILPFKLHAIHTACGIETRQRNFFRLIFDSLHAIHTACGIETETPSSRHPWRYASHCMQSIPLAVLKLIVTADSDRQETNCMQSIPLAVLKLHEGSSSLGFSSENCMQSIPLAVLKKDRFVQKIPKSMKRSPAAEPQGFFCYGS